MDNDISQEMIQQQMKDTRASLSEKIETLEQKVMGTVENATAAVTETVDAIKESVQETVTTVQEGVRSGMDSVKDAFDLPAQVRQHPWAMVGGSVAVGFCVGALLTSSSRPQYAPPQASSPPWTPSSSHGLAPQQLQAASAPAEPGIWASEVTKLKGLALGVLFGTARELLVSNMPIHLGEQIKDVVDSVTRKAGGQPLPSDDVNRLCEAVTPASAEEVATETETTARTSEHAHKQVGNGHEAVRRW